MNAQRRSSDYPDFSSLFGGTAGLSPRVASWLWVESRALEEDMASVARCEFPHLYTIGFVEGEGVLRQLERRVKRIQDGLTRGDVEGVRARCTADDILLFVMLRTLENWTLSGGASERGCESSEFFEKELEDLADSFRVLRVDPRIFGIWDVGADELLQDGWFEANDVIAWDPKNWFTERYSPASVPEL